MVALLVFAVGGAASAASMDGGQKSLLGKLGKEVNGHAALTAATKTFVVKNLLSASSNPIFIKAVIAQNGKNMSLASIKKTDKQWIGAEEELPIQKALMSNICAKELFAMARAQPAILEAFVMDNQGAVVCENSLTSDYWQGDEAKWKKSFKGGKGGVDAGKVKFDKSANAKLQQVSLPIIAAGGKVVGAVTWGLAIEKL